MHMTAEVITTSVGEIPTRGNAEMVDVTTFAQALLGPKSGLFWLATAAAALATSIIFAINARSRDAVDAALRKAANGHAAIGMFELCGPGAANAVHDKAILAPERLWCYDEAYLDTFVDVAAKSTTSFGDSALQRYLRPTLVWNDVAFAIALSLFTVLALLGIAPFLSYLPWSGYLMLIFAAIGVCYGVADVAEDWKLLTILDKGTPVDPTEAAAANALTRIKLVTISFSVIGGVTFLLLDSFAKLLRRSRA
jgi:hypothetical protein